jgi:hypothetical protein
MLTKNEINALNLSPTKKDFVQIWNELLDVAGKLSERWDPTSTNESDPGIVILKALTGIADKLNYNIDKNTLEAFMPTAAQEDSMRKLCEMLGYNIKYYQSATTNVTFKYYNANPTEEELSALDVGLIIPKFTVINNIDQDKSYFTIDHRPLIISSIQPSISIECMEGQIVKCESINDNDIITANQISENNRFYLPETQVAENGIFIYNICYSASELCDDGEPWTKVDNLNTQARGTKVFKFGFDSYESRPYIEFPEDYSKLFNDGIFIYYTRTSGVNGNISAHTLTQIELPTVAGWDQVAPESFSADNVYATSSGANVETIKQAYNNFKKTIGTFNTLVTCRDYMNKIYNMVSYEGKPLVSNILVTDLRNDINRAITICSCDDSGILYKEKPIVIHKSIQETKTEEVTNTITDTKPVFYNKKWYLGSITEGMSLDSSTVKSYIQASEQYSVDDFNPRESGTVGEDDAQGCWTINQNGTVFLTKFKSQSTFTIETVNTEHTSQPEINHFDLVFYPFKSYKQIKSDVKNIKSVYEDSFKLANLALLNNITEELHNSDIKTIAHNIIKPGEDHIISINNYLRLNATVATTAKLTEKESELVINNIKVALANAFNMRELDFSEEIPFEAILEVMESADNRIKIISLNEPALYTTFSVFKGFNSLGVPNIVEYAVASDWLSVSDAGKTTRFGKKGDDGYSFDTIDARKCYNKLAVRNLLAGRIPLFKYNTIFSSDFSEAPYYTTQSLQAGDSMPLGLTRQDNLNVYNIWMDAKGDIYTRQLKDGVAESAEFTKISAPYATADNTAISSSPENSDESVSGDNTAGGPSSGSTNNDGTTSGTITDDNTNASGSGVPGAVSNVIQEDEKGNAISSIETYSNIFVDDTSNSIVDLTLHEGEYVKFKTPNFRTKQTYPAYVNYHLKLKQTLTNRGEAKAATAKTLFDILNDSDSNKQKVLDYFNNIDADTKTNYVKRFTVSQKISKYSQATSSGEDLCTGVTNMGKAHVWEEATGQCRHCGKQLYSSVQKGPIKVVIKDENDAKVDEVDNFLFKSGFIKLTNDNFKANLAWDASDGDPLPKEGTKVPLTVQLEFENDNQSPFITDASIISKIQTAVTNIIEQSKNKVKSAADPTPILPTQCAWTVSFDFECVPFEPISLQEWEKFIRASSTVKSVKERIPSFKPVEENGTLFWRIYGQGYNPGKYVLANGEKLLKFDRNYFSTINNSASGSVLHNIYLVESLGSDAVPNLIANNTEYELQDGECLYIEYTSSSTTEDGSTKSTQKTEILESGTIIRPSGFTSGIMDSDLYSNSVTSYKTITFEQKSKAEDIPMYQLSANEQIEVREYAKVELSQNTLVGSGNNSKTSRTVYVYKNFNGVSELESGTNKLNNPIEGARTYTLKDGEYIFYTDSAKAEFAYFGSGTEIKLEGKVKLPTCTIIDIATILESGAAEIPWQSVILGSEDKIIFQEYQYVILGPEDTIKDMSLLEVQQVDGAPVLGKTWTCCENVTYTLHGSEEPITLPEIKAAGLKGNGWEACSLLELTASPTNAQTLRYEKGVIETGLFLNSVDEAGDGIRVTQLTPQNYAGESSQASLKFKTNLACNTGRTSISLDDLITNLTGTESFKIKIFAESAPAIVKTQVGKVVPADVNISLLDWTGEALAPKDLLENWYQVDLDRIKAAAKPEDSEYSEDSEVSEPHDNALVLPVLVTPNTYGVACIYINYTGTDEQANKTWIEVIPGTSKQDIVILNDALNKWEGATLFSGASSKLYLNPGINCIKFNKSGKFFIKTSATSQGILYFDNLKLVDCAALVYSTTNDPEKERQILTNGFNLEQLGYLNTDPFFKIEDCIDEETLIRLSEALYNEFNLDVTDIATNAQVRFNTNAKPVINSLETIDKLLEEIGQITELSTDDYKTLIAQYNDITSTLNLETDLLKAINSNKFDEQLLTYLSQLASKEITQEQLTKAVDSIEALIEEQLQARTDDQTLISFKDNLASGSSGPYLKAAKETLLTVKELLLQKANDTFLSDLNSFIEDLGTAINGDELSSIKASLITLQEAFTQDRNSELQTLLSQLSASLSLDDIYTLFEEIYELLEAENYSKLSTKLTTLQQLIKSNESQTLLTALQTKLEEIIEDESKNFNVTQLESILGELESVAGESGTSAHFLAGVNQAINTAVTEVNTAKAAQEAKYDSEEERATALKTIKTTVNNKIKAVKTAIDTAFSKRTSQIIDSITSSLSPTQIDTEVQKLQEFINSLDTNNGNITSELIDKITRSKDKYTKLKESLGKIIETTSWETLSSAVYASDLITYIISIWPVHFLEAIKHELVGIETDITKAILLEDPTELLSIVAGSTGITKLRETIKKYSNNFEIVDKTISATDQLVTIINAVESMCLQEQKNKAITGTVTNLRDIFGISTAFGDSESAKFAGLSANAQHRTQLIVEVLTALNDASLTQTKKVQLIANLNNELSTAKMLDEQLLEIIESHLYPKALQIKATFSKESFEVELAEKVIKEILAGEANRDNLTTMTKYLTILKQTFAYLVDPDVNTDALNTYKSNITSEQAFAYKTNSKALITEAEYKVLAQLYQDFQILRQVNKIDDSKFFDAEDRDTAIDSLIISLDLTKLDLDTSTTTKSILKDLLVILQKDLAELKSGSFSVSDEKSTTNLEIIALEEQLLAEILATDVDRDFYFTAPVEATLAIDLTNNTNGKPTLMNPATNYDINNINNSFVISKLDIDYLDEGIHLARSSKISY